MLRRVVISVISSIVVGAAIAYAWTNFVKIKGNVLAAGTIKVEITNKTDKPLVGQDMFPGQSVTGSADITNTGPQPVTLTMQALGTGTSTDLCKFSDLQLTVSKGGVQVSQQTHTVNDWAAQPFALLEGGILAPGEVVTVAQVATLRQDAPSSVQGDSCKWDEQFTATSVTSSATPIPTESPSATATVAPTPTEVPTPSPTEVPTPTPTATPTEVPTPSPTV